MSDMKRQIELYHLTKIYNSQRRVESPGRVSFTLGRALRPFRAQWRRQKHHDEYHHRESGRYQRKVLWNGKMSCAWGEEFRRILGYMPQQQNLYDSLQAAVSCFA